MHVGISQFSNNAARIIIIELFLNEEIDYRRLLDLNIYPK